MFILSLSYLIIIQLFIISYLYPIMCTKRTVKVKSRRIEQLQKEANESYMDRLNYAYKLIVFFNNWLTGYGWEYEVVVMKNIAVTKGRRWVPLFFV